MKVLIIILLLVGCGQYQGITVDARLKPYMQSFEANIGMSTAGISAKMANLSDIELNAGDEVGLCTLDHSTRTIYIDLQYWNQADSDSRMQLMYHELGHCALFLHHTSLLKPNGCPISIMYPLTFPAGCFKDKEPYFQQLRTWNTSRNTENDTYRIIEQLP